MKHYELLETEINVIEQRIKALDEIELLSHKEQSKWLASAIADKIGEVVLPLPALIQEFLNKPVPKKIKKDYVEYGHHYWLAERLVVLPYQSRIEIMMYDEEYNNYKEIFSLRIHEKWNLDSKGTTYKLDGISAYSTSRWDDFENVRSILIGVFATHYYEGNFNGLAALVAESEGIASQIYSQEHREESNHLQRRVSELKEIVKQMKFDELMKVGVTYKVVPKDNGETVRFRVAQRRGEFYSNVKGYRINRTTKTRGELSIFIEASNGTEIKVRETNCKLNLDWVKAFITQNLSRITEVEEGYQF